VTMGARSVCSTPGCPVLVFPAGRCAECVAKAAAMRRARGGSTAKRGYDKGWQRTRKAYLRLHPYCECAECAAVPMPLRQPATEVDHIDGLGPLGPRGHDWSNLRAMTKAHHSRETAKHQPGGWNDRG
jgi:5-methylcytosine-specific restriction protein A